MGDKGHTTAASRKKANLHSECNKGFLVFAGEEWNWIDAGYKVAGGVLIVVGNYFYFEFRAAARAKAGLPPSELEIFEV